MILAHLDQPAAAMAAMLRVATKPGGIIALRESDFRMWAFYLEIKGMKESNEMICAVQTACGACVDAGTKFVKCALDVGIARDRIRTGAGTWCYTSKSEREMWGETMASECEMGSRREKALELGLATVKDLEQMAKGWREWIKTEDGWFGCMHGEVLITR